MIYECNDIAKVEMLFGDWYLPDLRESPEHVELKFFVTDPETPKSAMMFYDGDAFYAGEADEELVRDKPKGSVSMLPQNEAWEKLIESCFPDAEKITRYAIKKEANFDLEKLKAIVDTLPEGYELKRIDEEIYDLCLNVTDPDLEDVVGCYDTKEEFFKYSRGFVMLKDGKVVAGASSCFRYCDGI